MKKLALLLAILILVTDQVKSQSMYLGALVIDANTGIEVMSTQYRYKLKNLGIEKDTTTIGGAANYNFSFGVEVGLAKWLSIGTRAKVNTYFTEQDKLTGRTPSASSFDLMGSLNLHATHNKHFNLLFGGSFGYSGLDYKSNDTNGTNLNGTGTFADIHTTMRLYIRRFGFHLTGYAPFVNYSKMTSNNSLFNNYVLATWKGSGFGLNIGIQYRFFSVRKDVIN
jgi:hypothetical protein